MSKAEEKPDSSEHNDVQDTSSPEPKMSSKESNGVVTVRLQTIANVLTIVLALAAIGLAIWEGYQNRKFFRLSVLPHLEPIEANISTRTPITSEYFPLLGNRDSLFAVSYILENSGLGPAVLKNIVVYQEGKKIFESVQSDSKYYLGKVDDDLEKLPFPSGFLKTPYSAGAMLEADEVHPFISIFIPYDFVKLDTLTRSPANIVMNKVLESYSFVFCYCSVYGTDCGQVHLGAEPPKAEVCEF